MNKSQEIRRLTDEGKKVHEIAKELKSNYAFVYGVVARYKEFGPPTDRKANSKSEQIRVMYLAGKKIPEIRTALSIDYAFAYGVIKKLKEDMKNEHQDN